MGSIPTPGTSRQPYRVAERSLLVGAPRGCIGLRRLVGDEPAVEQVAAALRQERQQPRERADARGDEDLEARALDRAQHGVRDVLGASARTPPELVPAASSVSTTIGITTLSWTPVPRSSWRTAVR